MSKNKMKTKKSAAKRYQVSGTGKVMHRQIGMNHLLSKKSAQRKRQLNQDGELTGAEASRAKRLVPYK
ncbi:MAG: 50S ribosomal protein L35 [candidate division WS1 bacterium]|jgi:large subunit ribosomal protein L35|nr:50S ribosomal protein L35 [candidate division WS1 bacterium]